MPRFEALNAQVVGVSADHAATLQAFSEQFKLKHALLSDFRRQMLPAYNAMVMDEKSPIFRYAKRAYFIIDRQGILRHIISDVDTGRHDRQVLELLRGL